ncbi:ceramide synthase LOH2 [Nymphaea colorata]|nr:ceramide synthase LOH2 [Nymphaea colorata]
MDSVWMDFKMAICFAFAILVTRFVLHVFVYQKLANWLLDGGTALSLKLTEAKQVKIAKCCESMWKFTYYATVQACVICITYHEPWFRDKKEFFKGWPKQDLKPSLGLLYMCQCGFYIYSIAALLTWETRRKDFSIMMSHHIVTVVLIGFSYVTRFFRIGSIILALHDASDVFMEAAKLFKYCEKELAASVFFGCFAISWLILRLIIFPFWVIWSSSYDSVQYLPLNEVYVRALYYLFNTMLLTLLVFHVYWWILIYSMILRQLKNRGKVGEDIRSDSEDED